MTTTKPESAEAVAWAVVGNKSGDVLNVFHGPAEKMRADSTYWPEHGFHVRPLVYGGTAPPRPEASGLSRSLKLAAAEEQAEAWQAVCALLSELRPDWAVGPGTGQELALAAIRHGLATAPRQASKWKRIIGNWQERVAAAGFNGVEEAIEAIEASIAPQQASAPDASVVGVEGMVERVTEAVVGWATLPGDSPAEPEQVAELRKVISAALADQSLKNESDQEQQGGTSE